MEAYVKVMQARLKARGVGGKKEFFREFVKEVKIDGDNVTVTYRWPLNLGAGHFAFRVAQAMSLLHQRFHPKKTCFEILAVRFQ